MASVTYSPRFQSNYLTFVGQDVPLTNKEFYMKTVILTVMFLLAAIVSGAHGAEMSEAEISEANLIKLVNKHRVYQEGKPFDTKLYDLPEKQMASNKEYIFKTIDAELDRIELPRKPTGEERYVGR